MFNLSSQIKFITEIIMKLKIYLFLLLITVFSNNVFAQAASFNQAILDKILLRAKETNSDSVLIMQNGKIIGEYYAGKKDEKIELMSCTKSIVSLAIGRLIEQGKIKSVDQPVYEFYPEWKQGKKSSVTIKHLLNHTSGLQNVPNAELEIYSSKDFVKLALAAEISDEPGTKFSYNNKAVNLLAGIVQVASGKRLDVFMRDEFFNPMQIKDFGWTLDAAGNPHVMAGLQIPAADFIKFGQLILNRGKWDGKQIVSEKWVDASLAQSQPFAQSVGLLWWRMSSNETYTIDDEHLQILEKAGVEKSFLEKVEPLKGKVYQTDGRTAALVEVFGRDYRTIVQKEMASKHTPLFKTVRGEIDGYNANGYLGQFLVIVPKSNLVAVRQVKRSDKYNSETDGFNDFMSLVMQLTK